MAAVPLMGRTLHTQINYAQIHTNYRKTHIRKEKDTQTETYIENCDSGTQPTGPKGPRPEAEKLKLIRSALW